MATMSMQSRKEVVKEMVRKYRRAGREYRRKLVGELCSVCGYERKYAIKVLTGNRPGPRGLRRGGGRRLYDEQVAQVAAAIWKPADYPCGKRLAAMLPLWLPAHEARCGRLNEALRARVLQASPATLDRLLEKHRARLPKRRGGTKPGRLLRTQIPIRCESWKVDGPGWLEADTVDHGGPSTAGDFMRSVTYTDIFSAWIEQTAIWNKSGAAVLERTRQIEKDLPFPILGFDSDNGGEFINHALVRFFGQRVRPVYFTRSRSYRKNDNAHVEQKNWTKVRQLLGYARYDNPELVELVDDLYRNEWRLLQNFFQPVMKLEKKERHGSRVKKRYGEPQTPAQRLLNWKGLGMEKKTWIETLQRTLDPISLSEAVNRKLQVIRRILREGVRHAA
jgi:hypothetical protein